MSEPVCAFERDPYQTELATEVIRVETDGERPYAVLSDTILYPEGGGQPPDRGWLGAVPVLDVQRSADEVRHYVATPVPTGPTVVRLDWQRRFDHMQHHTGQHLLTAVALGQFGWRTKAFHLQSQVCDIELDPPELTATQLDQLADAVAAAIRAALPIRPRRVTRAEYQTLDVRSRGLPPDHDGSIRLIEIEGIDLNTCGGTHLRSTAEIECLHLVGTERMRGGTRVLFVAGRRARQRMAAHEQRTAELRRLLGADDDQLVAAVVERIEREKLLKRTQQDLEQDLAKTVVRSLASRGDGPHSDHFPDRDGGFLRQVGLLLSDAAPRALTLLTAGAGDTGTFAVIVGSALKIDIRPLGAAVAQTLDGRGGGAGQVYQGKAKAVEKRAEALAHLTAIWPSQADHQPPTTDHQPPTTPHSSRGA